MREQSEVLRHVADRATVRWNELRVTLQKKFIQSNDALRGSPNSGQQIKKRRFTRSGLAENPDDGTNQFQVQFEGKMGQRQSDRDKLQLHLRRRSSSLKNTAPNPMRMETATRVNASESLPSWTR